MTENHYLSNFDYFWYKYPGFRWYHFGGAVLFLLPLKIHVFLLVGKNMVFSRGDLAMLELYITHFFYTFQVSIHEGKKVLIGNFENHGTRGCGGSKYTPLGVQKNFHEKFWIANKLIWKSIKKQEKWHQDHPYRLYRSWVMGFQSLGVPATPQNFDPP